MILYSICGKTIPQKTVTIDSHVTDYGGYCRGLRQRVVKDNEPFNHDSVEISSDNLKMLNEKVYYFKPLHDN